MAITKRSVKGSPLTHAELDTNFQSCMRNDIQTTSVGINAASTYLDIKYNNAAAGGIRLYDSDSLQHGYWYGNGSGEHGFLDNDGSWAVRIRTSTSAMILYCNGNAEFYVYTSYVYSPGSHRAPVFYCPNATTYYFDGSATGDSLRTIGDVVAYYSDERLKDVHGPITDALNKTLSLTGFYYTPNETAQKLGYKPNKQVGVSAQAVQKVLPEVIKSAPVDANYMTVLYERLAPLLIEAVKELSDKFDVIKQRAEETA